MPLSAGDKIGHYEVLSLLGQGGMGEVYRARDTKLKREVAIKVLPEAFARDPERMARFQREAEVLASLNHPNIATIHGVEDRALVMELVEGNSPKGPLPFDEAWKIASQIAAALEYAHERGIMHRDLKPANIMITPDGVVKLLDFGLAKAFSNQREPSASPENSPTLTLGATEVGVILGTAAYMAPEQARGKTVDKRADIWSFGVVLYELLSGERVFTGEDAAETLAAVIHKQPDLVKVPRQARRLLEECLQKDPKQRLRDIGDAKRLLGGESHAQLSPAPRHRSWLPWCIAAFFLLALMPANIIHLRETSPVAEPVMFQLFPPEKTTLGKFAVSPDGRKIAFYVEGSGLWVRSLDSAESRLIASSTASGIPTFFWSYDSRYVAFPRGDNLNALMKVDLTGAPPQTVCEIKSIVVGGSWNRDGTILFGSVAPGGVWRVSAAGGAASPVTISDPSRQDQAHVSPVFLPDGKHFVYLRLSTTAENTGIYVGSLDTKPEQQTSKRLVATNFNPVIAISSNPGSVVLLFLRENALLAQPLDLAKLEMTGEPVRIAAGIANEIEFGNFGASNNGVLAYRTGSATGNASRRLIWLDRAGTSLSEAGTDYYSSLKLAPDTSRVAATRIDTNPNNIWLFDFARKTPTRLTAGSGYDGDPAWSPDGAQVAYVSLKSGMGLYRRLSNGSGAEETLLPPGGDARELDDWSHDGRFLIYSEVNSKTKADLWILPMAPQKPGEARQPAVYLNSEFNETEGQFSPNGRWVAYVSDESGRSEVYIQPFPLGAGGDGKVRVSSGGGLMPRWRRDGKELFFVVNGGDVMAGDIADTPSLKVGIPKRLFNTIFLSINPNNFTWDVAPDGKRFLVESANLEKGAPSPITVVLNWQAEIKK